MPDLLTQLPKTATPVSPPQRFPRRITRIAVAGSCMVCALVHLAPGMHAMARQPWWVHGAGPPHFATLCVTAVILAVAVAGLLGAGFGLLRVSGLRTWWFELGCAGAGASMLLVLLYYPQHTWLLVAGDAALVSFLTRPTRIIDRWRAAALEPRARVHHRHRHALFTGFAWAALAYITIVAAIRPIYLRWGATEAEAAAALPGDAFAPERGYQVLHAVNIDAPPHDVWKWVIQLGQDRGGFYSYAWLENLFGLRVQNTERIVQAWQQRAVGDFVPGAPPDWLGGRVRDEAGWKITALEPARVLVLDKWGAFILLPRGAQGTRFLVRSLGNPQLDFGLVAGMGSMLLLEPAHFIMQRKMMLEIKRLSEGAARTDAQVTHAR